MQVNYSNLENGELEIQISGEIGIDQIKELKEIFSLRLNNTDNLKIIVCDIVFFDLSFIQLLVVLAREANRLNKTLQISMDMDEDNERLIKQMGLGTEVLTRLTS